MLCARPKCPLPPIISAAYNSHPLTYPLHVNTFRISLESFFHPAGRMTEQVLPFGQSPIVGEDIGTVARGESPTVPRESAIHCGTRECIWRTLCT